MTTIGISSAGAVPTARTSRGRWPALSGVAFGVVLAVAATMTAGLPNAKNAAKDQAWIIKHTGLLTASVFLTVIAVIVGLYFLTWLHSQLAGADHSGMGTLFLAGTVVFAMSGAVAAGINFVLGSDPKHLSTGSLQLMTSIYQGFNYPMTCIGLAALYIAAGTLIRRTGALPGWLAWVSWVFAFLAATVLLGIVALLGTVLWVIVVSVILATRQPAES